MANKGSQALLKSDVSVIKDIVGGNVTFSVSTVDVDGVRQLNLPLDGVLPSLVDVPYEIADSFARKLEFERKSLVYKVVVLASFILMFLQLVLSVYSVFLVKVGLKGLYRSQVLERMKGCDLVVSYSDENLKEGASFLPANVYWTLTWWSMLVSKTWDILVARYLGKSVVMFPNSLGPFRTTIGRILARLALNRCNVILVREPVSYRLVKSLHITSPTILTFDTTWLFESKTDAKLKHDSSLYVGVSPGVYSHVFSEDGVRKHVAAYAEALDRGAEKFGFSFIFMPLYISGFRYDDLEIARMIVERMKYKNHTAIVEARSAEEFKSLVDKMDMMISSKMHPAVWGLSGCVPTVCIAYDHKQTGLFESLDLAECVIPLCELSGSGLFSRMYYVWNNRNGIRSILKTRGFSIRRNIKQAIRSALSQVNGVRLS